MDIKSFKKLKTDLLPLGFDMNGDFELYYCTPKKAQIIASSGVDGIHYCTVPQFGEMIFAVSPMNFGDCVHPIARNFEDLLRLLLHCADIAALEEKIAALEEEIAASATNYGKLQELSKAKEEAEAALEEKMDRWVYLNELAEQIENQKQ